MSAIRDEDWLRNLNPNTFTFGDQFQYKRHGGLYDRGSADAYYGRPCRPHYWTLGTNRGEEVTELTKDEIALYMRGYDEEEDRKVWE